MRPRFAVAVRSGAAVVLLAAIAVLPSACGSTDGGSSGRPPRAPTEPPASNEAPTHVLELDVDSLVAIAINADQTAHTAAILYARSLQEDPFVAPTGNWFVLVYAPGLGVYRSPKAVVSDGVLPIDLTAAHEPVPGATDQNLAAAMEALADFFVAHQRAYLASMFVLSGTFRAPLMDQDVVITEDDAETLRGLLYDLDATVDGAVAAVELLSAQAGVSAEARPAGGLFDWLRDRLTDVVGGRDRAAKARDEIILAAERMTAGEREQAFDAISSQTGFGAGERSADAFFLALLDGQYDNQAAQIRNYLQNHEDFFHFFDRRNIETARDEGGALLVAGTEFYAEAIKDVLDKVFPGIGKGWELVEKLEERLQQVQEPSNFVLRSLLVRYLDEFGYEYNDEQVDEVMGALLAAVNRARSGRAPVAPATPTEPAAPTQDAVGEYGVFVHEYFGMLVGRADDLAATRVCELRGGGLCEGENAEKALGPVPMVLGPFDTYEEAAEAYCADIIPGTYYVRPLGVGPAATMGFDGEEHAVDNAPGCT